LYLVIFLFLLLVQLHRFILLVQLRRFILRQPPLIAVIVSWMICCPVAVSTDAGIVKRTHNPF
jgi:hypothetical protein